MKRLAIAAALSLPACLANPDTFQAGNGFDGWRAETFAEAARDWCQGADLCAEIDDGGGSEVRVAALNPKYNGYAENSADGSTTISVREDLDSELLYYVLLHELGHHWHCTDNDNDDTIMVRNDGGNVRRLTIADFDCGG